MNDRIKTLTDLAMMFSNFNADAHETRAKHAVSRSPMFEVKLALWLSPYVAFGTQLRDHTNPSLSGFHSDSYI